MKIRNASTILAFTVGVLALQGCTTDTSGKLYKTGEVGVAQRAYECTVVSAEAVAVQSDSVKHIGTGTGALIGGLTGALLGDKVGGGSGRDLAQTIGATAGALGGAAAGTHAGAALGKRPGVRYTVQLADADTRIVIQELPESESALPPGSTCWLSGSTGRTRITPR